MVHLSIAIGRFFEALLYALARGVGLIAVVMLLGVAALIAAGLAARAAWRRGRHSIDSDQPEI